MKKYIVLFCFFGSFFTHVWAQKTTNQIQQTAQVNLQNVLSKIPFGREQEYGFDNRTDFNASIIGQPIQLITLDKDFFLDQNNNNITFLNEWRVPVSVNQKVCTLLTVYKNNDDFQVVDLGGTMLGRELQSKISDNEQAFLLRIFPLHIDFIVKTSANLNFHDADYIPMQSAIREISAEKLKASYNQNDFFQLVRAMNSLQSKN